MKFLLIAAFLVLYVAATCGQNCPGRPSDPNCEGGKDVGRSHGCNHRQPNEEMWWYNRHSNDCLKMKYLGCFGNRNRYCDKDSCMRKCHRRN